MERPTRKPNRLPEYNYSQNGAYFVTICTGDKQNLFWNAVGADIIRPQMENEDFVLHLPLSEYGRIAEQGILNIPQCYPSVTVEKYCIMPNHIHMILSFSHDCGRIISAPTLSRVVGQMKRWVSKQIGAGIWQKSYYERVIRNGTEYEEIWQYIQENPLKYLLKEETI
ncbi:MAG: transposase [Faecousia sp.]